MSNAKNIENMKTTMTITVNGKKSGEIIYFKIEMDKSRFFQVVEMGFNSIQDILNGEKNGIYKIV